MLLKGTVTAQRRAHHYHIYLERAQKLEPFRYTPRVKSQNQYELILSIQSVSKLWQGREKSAMIMVLCEVPNLMKTFAVKQQFAGCNGFISDVDVAFCCGGALVDFTNLYLDGHKFKR